MTPPVKTAPAASPDAASSAAIAIADFLVKTEHERTRLFRRHLRATVGRASPLLTELAVMEGISLEAAVSLLQPPSDWPWRPLYDDPSVLLRRSQRRKGWLGSGHGSDSVGFRRTFASPGLVLRDTDHPRGRFGIRPCNGVLGFTAGLGPALLSAFGTSALLKLPHGLPETLVMSLPGRQLDQLIDHPLLRGRGYRISKVLPDLVDETPVLMFRVPLEPFTVPLPGDAS